MKFKYRHISIDIYGIAIYLFEYNEENCKKLKAEYRETAAGYTNVCNNGNICIGLVEKYATVPVIAHECCHAVHKIFSKCGITPDLINDEAEAFLLGHIIEKVLKEKDKLFKQKDSE